MGLEIKISADGMLRVLINAGIEATDAKAIIFDLLQYPDKVTQEPKKEKVVEEVKKGKRGRPKREVLPVTDTDVEDDVEDTEDAEYVKDDGESENEDISTIRRPRRINFKNFGGASKPLAAT